VVCCVGITATGAVVSVVTDRVVVVVGGGESAQAVRAPSDRETARNAASRAEVMWLVILKSFIGVYSVKSNLG
jgi:hypothetical protein